MLRAVVAVVSEASRMWFSRSIYTQQNADNCCGSFFQRLRPIVGLGDSQVLNDF
jgi:hypothetical protein